VFTPSRVIEEIMPSRDSLKAFADRYAQAWCSQDARSVASFFSEQGSLSVNGAPPAVGRSAIADVAREFMAAFPDLTVTVDDVISGDLESIFRWTLTGTNTGPGGTGRRVRISGFEEWRFGSDGLIAQSKGHFDAVDYARQIEEGADDRSRRPRLAARSVALVGIVATVHFVVWLSAFRAVFMAVEADRSFPALVELALGLVLNVLGAPLMFLLYLPTSSLGSATPSWVDDTRFIIGLAASNSLLVSTYRLLRRRRETRPGAPNKP